MDRHTDFMRVEIAGFQEANIVGRHHRQTTPFSQFYRGMQIVFFILSAGTDQLKEVAIGKMRFVKRHAFVNQGAITAQQATSDVAHAAAGEQNQTFF
ncbi:hypothetical protein CICRMM096B_16800 [Citrobacter cronae]